MRFRVYICGPITRGNLADNVNQATAAFVALAKAGFAPLNPMWSVYAKPCEQDYDFDRWQDPVLVEDRCSCIGTRNGNDEMQHADWIGLDLPWVEVSHAVLRLPGESAGADLETDHAIACGIPVFHDIAALVTHFAGRKAA